MEQWHTRVESGLQTSNTSLHRIETESREAISPTYSSHLAKTHNQLLQNKKSVPSRKISTGKVLLHHRKRKAGKEGDKGTDKGGSKKRELHQLCFPCLTKVNIEMKGPAIEAKDQLNALINSGSCQCVEELQEEVPSRSSAGVSDQEHRIRAESMCTVNSRDLRMW